MILTGRRVFKHSTRPDGPSSICAHSNKQDCITRVVGERDNIGGTCKQRSATEALTNQRNSPAHQQLHKSTPFMRQHSEPTLDTYHLIMQRHKPGYCSYTSTQRDILSSVP